jgi:hypothetical protein
MPGIETGGRAFTMRRLLFCLTLTLVTAALSVDLSADLSAGVADRHPLAVKAEEGFFAAFNHDPLAKAAPLRGLWAAALTDPADARTWLLLGLDHLWLAAEGDRRDPLTVEHLVLAEQFLTRAQELDPTEKRIPSWLVPVRLSLSSLRLTGGKGDRTAEKDRILRDLLDAYAQDPTFHSFTVALVGFDAGRETPEFQRGLAALEATNKDCAESADPTCRNRQRWPHNREAYVTFEADYELKAGHTARARDLLLAVQRIPSYPEWPFRAETENRLKNLDALAALYADADPSNDPPHLLSSAKGMVCQGCHLAQ